MVYRGIKGRIFVCVEVLWPSQPDGVERGQFT